MKAFGKHVLDDLHINPIHRDLLVVFIAGILIAMAISSVAVMIIVSF